MNSLDWSGALRPLRNMYVAVLILAVVVTLIGLTLRFSAGVESFYVSFMASLWEDLLFFFSIGIALFAVQRIERDQARTLSDRLFILANSKKGLTANEKKSLTKVIADNLSYVKRDYVKITIKAYDTNRNVLQSRIVRDMVHANYTTDMRASHNVHVNLKPTGTVEGEKIVLDPIFTTEFDCPDSCEPRKVSDLVEALDRVKIFDGAESVGEIDEKLPPNSIAGGKCRLYEVRYTSWVDLNAENGLFHGLTTRKYEELLQIDLFNESDQDLEVHCSLNGTNRTIHIKRDKSHSCPSLRDLAAGAICSFTLRSTQPKAAEAAPVAER